MTRLSRARIAYFHDVFMAAASFLIAFYLRVGDAFVFYPIEFILLGTALFTAVSAGVFWFMRLYRGVWGYASLNDMMAITRAVTLALLVFLPLMFLVTRLQDLPRSLLLINWFVLLALLGGPRILYRIFKDRSLAEVMTRDGHQRVPVLLIGAGDGTELFLRAMGQPGAGYRVVGILDRDGGHVERKIHGVDVLGRLEEIGPAVERLSRHAQRPRRLIITSQKLEGAQVRALLEFAEAHGMPLDRLPSLTDFKTGVSDRIEVKPVAIEDLLGRPQAVLDREGMRALIAGRRILVTGAGGTIGSELVRQVSDFGPARLSLLDNSEHGLYGADLELGERHPDLARDAILGDVRDAGRIAEVVRGLAPELVFHAAALKHVPVVEAHPAEGVLTNTIGTRNLADACRANGVGAMVLISTDKAVNPVNVMGATKRVAESYCQALDIAEAAREGGTRYVTVRFGNVLGSTGSVVPLFQRQLAAGGPLTVTDAGMTRYFMTTREAVELVLQASVLGLGGAAEAGKIYVLDMGEPVRILDLAKQMIRLAGLHPESDVEIVFTGPRPGEKLHEALFHDAERPVPTERAGILLAAPRAADDAFLSRAIAELEEAARAGDLAATEAVLRRMVPEYAPREAARPPAALTR